MISSDSDFNPAVLVLPGHNGEIDRSWLADVQSRLGGQWLVPAATDRPPGTKQLDTSARDRAALARAALDHAGEDGVLILQSGLQLPERFAGRLANLARASDAPPLLLFPGNHDPALNPAAGLDGSLSASVCDAVANLAGTGSWTPVDHPASSCAWLNSRDPGAALQAIAEGTGWLFDGLVIHDPDQALDHGELNPPAIAIALGQVRLALERISRESELVDRLPLVGWDDQPVTLHISHDWGGGVARWISDFLAADQQGHHLVLASGGQTDGRIHGQRLRLYAAGPGRGLIDEWILAPAIASSVERHEQYRKLLTTLIERHGIGRLVVSSLIGHSLDAFCTGLPTLQVLHDFYPAWPVLDHDPLEFADGDHVDLQRAIDEQGDRFLFRQTGADHWQALARAWGSYVEDRQVTLIAPTRQVTERFDRLCPGTGKRVGIFPHGFDGWPGKVPRIRPRALPDGRLNLVVVGRLSPGKGLGLLEAALPQLCRHARITLLGCGHHGMRLFGQAGVDIVLDYRYDELPDLLARLAPQAALFLSTVAETWNYVLSETRSLGLVPIATHTGSFIERIDHGRDGILFNPDAHSLVEAIAALASTPSRLESLAGKLPTEPARAEVVAAVNRLTAPVLAAPQPARSRLPDGNDSRSLPFLLAQARLERSALVRQVEALHKDLQERTAWARKHERLTAERTGWAKGLETDLEQSRQVSRNLQTQLRQAEQLVDERTRWAHALQKELDAERGVIRQQQDAINALINSSSWRLTRPWRFVGRLLINARLHRVWSPLRWPGLTGQLFSNIRLLGMHVALSRMHQVSLAPAPAPAPSTPMPDTESVPEGQAVEPVTLNPATNNPKASIVMPVFNKLAYTAACLHSINLNTPVGQYEVIVVDDCSSDDTSDYLDQCSGLRVIRNRQNRGFIHSCNAGASAAKGEYLVLLNNDTKVTPGWLEALIGTFSTHPDAGVVGARLIYPDGRLQEAGGIIFNDASGWNYGRGDNPDKPQYNFVSETDYVSGACLALRRQEFLDLGGFDTRFAPAYYEDTDLCFQVRDLGKQVIYQPAATVVHHEGISSGTDESSGTKRYQTVNRDKFRDKWAGMLAEHPEPKPDDSRSDPVRHLRFRRRPRRVLVIDAVTPQPDHDSGSVRLMAMMTLLGEMDFQVSFMPENLAWVEGYSEALQQAGIEVLCTPRIESTETWLTEHGDDLELVIVSRHYVLASLLRTLRRRCRNALLVFDTVDLHFLREEREAEVTGSSDIAACAAVTRRQELALVAKADVTLVVSAVERDLLAELAPESDVRIVSNIHEIRERVAGWKNRSGLLFVGGFQHVPNVDAALWLVDDIFPRVREQLPGIELHLIGSRMPPEIAGIDAPGVRVHGFVPDLDPFLDGCRLSVAPLRYGAGVKGKINQAMSHGLPVIATSCAAEGMFLEHECDVLIADSVEDFARQVIRAYSEEALWTRLAEGGLENVKQHFSVRAARAALERIVQSRP